jgi:hypothetical protein
VLTRIPEFWYYITYIGERRKCLWIYLYFRSRRRRIY